MFLLIYLIGCLISLIASIFVLYKVCNNEDESIQAKRTSFVNNSGLVLIGAICSWLTILVFITGLIFSLFSILFEYLSKKLFK